jgi:hypothetical protein
MSQFEYLTLNFLTFKMNELLKLSAYVRVLVPTEQVSYFYSNWQGNWT